MTYILTFTASFLGCMAAYGVKYLIERYRMKQVKKRIDACTEEMHKTWDEFMAVMNWPASPKDNVVNFNLYKAMKDED